MSNVINMVDYLNKDSWQEIFYRDDGVTELQIFLNKKTCQVEIYQMVDGKSHRSCLSAVDSVALIEALKSSLQKI